MREDEINEALADLEEALQASPDYIDAYIFKADLENQLSRLDSAISTFAQAEKYGLPYYSFYNYGTLLFQAGNYERAIEILDKYRQHPRAREKYIAESNRLIESSAFAMRARQKPKDYDPQNLGPKVNTDQLEYFPSISGDGRELVFTHRRLTGDRQDEDFWKTTRDSLGGPWQEARRMDGFLNTVQNEGAQSLSADGQVLFFAACNRDGGFGSCDIYASFRESADTWSRAVNLGPGVNSALWESQPSISPDGRTLYFVRGRGSRDKNLDIYYSRYGKQGWEKAKALGANINTPYRETSPFIHFDNQTLYFSSDGHPGMGDLDFFVARKAPGGAWKKPQNLGYPINTTAQEFSLIVSPDGKTGFFSSDNMETGYGRLDLYEFVLPDSARASAVAYLQGKVYDKESGKPLQARVDFTALEDSTISFSHNSNKRGKFYAVLPGKRAYALSVNRPEYLFYSRNFVLEAETPEEAKTLKIPLVPVREGEKITLENIFFEYDSYRLDRRSYPELRNLVRFLENNPLVRVRLEGHTDSQGSPEYNLKLSKQRARSVYEYLTTRQIDPERLEYQGFGATQPIATNETEEGRAKNRRTELHIIARKKLRNK